MLQTQNADKNNYEGFGPIISVRKVKSDFFIAVPTPLIFDKLQPRCLRPTLCGKLHPLPPCL